MHKRLLSGLLVLVMLLGLLPNVVFAKPAADPVDLTTDQYTIDFDFNIVQDNQGLCFNMKDTGTFIMWQVSTFEGLDTGVGDVVLLRPHFKSGGSWKGYPGQKGYNVEAVNLTEKLGLTGSQLEARTEPVHERIVVSGNNIKTYFGLNGETAETPTEELIFAYDFTYSAAESLPFYGLGFRMNNDGAGHSQEITQIDNLIAKCNTTGNVLYQNDFSDGKPTFVAGNGVSFVTEDGWLQVGNPEKVSEQIYVRAADSAILEIPEGQQAVYTCELAYDGETAISVSLDGTNAFSIAPGDKYGAGTYTVTLSVNPAQSMTTVHVDMPDGVSFTRGLSQLANATKLIVNCSDLSVVKASSLVYEDVDVRTYELTTEEPVLTGFEANVYYHTTSFVDARTTRAFAWAANVGWLGGSDMALLYREAGTEAWIEAEVIPEEEGDPVQDFFKCDITGLTPDTTYEYQFGKKDSADKANDWSPVRTFTTAKEEIDEFTFLTVGDTQSITWNGLTSDDKGSMFAKATYEAAFAEIENPAFMVHTGDVVEYGSNVEHWNWFFKSFGEKGANTPLFTTLGGHDSWPTADNNAFYYGHIFNNPDNGGAAAYNPEILSAQTANYAKRLINCLDESVYSFNYDNLHMIFLNTGDAHQNDEWLTEAQRDWLIADLEANRDAQWTIILAHESFYGYNNALQDVIEAYGVDLVMSGHTHWVSRTFPIKGGVAATKSAGNDIPQGVGTVYAILGSTALNHEYTTGLEPNKNTAVNDLRAVVAGPDILQPTYSYVTVSDEKLSLTTKQLNGLVLDEFTIHAAENNVKFSKQALIDTIAAAEAAMEAVTVSDLTPAEVALGTKFVSNETMNALKTALTAADTAYYSADTEDAVNTAAAALQTAVDAFNAAVQVGQSAGLTISATTKTPMDVTVTINGTTSNVTLPATLGVTDGDEVTVNAVLRNDVEYAVAGWTLNGETISDAATASFTAKGIMDLSLDVDWIGYVNLAQGAAVSSPNGQASTTSWKYANMTDGNPAEGYGWSSKTFGKSTTASSPVVVNVDMKTSTMVDRFHIYPRTTSNGLTCAPVDFVISVSTDNSTFTPVATVTGAEHKTDRPFVVQLDNAVEARYIRISTTKINKTDGSNNGYVQIMEFGAYRTKDVAWELPAVAVKFETEAEQARFGTLSNAAVTFENGDAILTATTTITHSNWTGYVNDPWAMLSLSGLPTVLAQEHPYVVMIYQADGIDATDTPVGGLHLGAGHTTSAVGGSWTPHPLVDDGKWNSVILDLTDNAYWKGVPNFFRVDFLQEAMNGDAVRVKSFWLVSSEEEAQAIALRETTAANELEAAAADRKAAAAVDALIEAIDVRNPSGIQSARAAYERLTEAGKALVTKYAVLLNAEAGFPAVEIDFDTQAEQARVGKTNNTTVTFEDGRAVMTVTGKAKDPWALISLSDLTVRAQDYPYVAVVYKVVTGNGTDDLTGCIHVGAGSTTAPTGEASPLYDVNESGLWQGSVVSFSGNVHWKGQPNFIRADYLQTVALGDQVLLDSYWLVSSQEEAEAIAAQMAQRFNDEEAAAAVTAQIADLGEVTLDSKAAIDEARAAYDALTENGKALVANYETLTAAEAAYAALVKAEADKNAAAAVDALIEAVSAEDKAAIDAARAAYDALTDEQKALVTKLPELEAAELAYKTVNTPIRLIVTAPEEVNANDETVVCTVSGKDMTNTASMVLTFAITEEYLTDPVVEAKNGWYVVAQTWKDGVLNVALANNTGVSGEGDILTLTLTVLEKAGEASVAITETELAAYLGEGETFISGNLDQAAVTITVKHNIFDVNKDGVVNILDLTRAQRYYGKTNEDADVNRDGKVDVEDLIMILNNYYEPFMP